MKIGILNIPSLPLSKAIEDIKKIYKPYMRTEIGSKEIGEVFKYKTYNTGVFYRRINTMIAFGLLEGKRNFSVTELGESLVHPEPYQEGKSKADAFMNIQLWGEICNEFKKNPPPVGGFWTVLRKHAKMDPESAKKIEKKIRKRYMEDVSLIPEDQLLTRFPPYLPADVVKEVVEAFPNPVKPKSSSKGFDEYPEDEFDKFYINGSFICIPKENAKEIWEKIRGMLDINYDTKSE